MSIILDDIKFIGKLSATTTAKELIKKETNSLNHPVISDIKKIKSKFSEENILNSEYSFEIVTQLILGCIKEYHEQLRKTLLEKSIDIGDIDEATISHLSSLWIEQHHDSDD